MQDSNELLREDDDETTDEEKGGLGLSVIRQQDTHLDDRNHEDEDDEDDLTNANFGQYGGYMRGAPPSLLSTDGPFGFWCPIIAVAIFAVLLLWLGFLTVVLYQRNDDINLQPQPVAGLQWNTTTSGFYEATMTGDKKAWRERFINLPDANNILTWLRYYTSMPHLAGSDEDRQQVTWTRNKLQDWSITADVSTYFVMRTTPAARHVSLLASPGVAAFELSLADAYELSESPNPTSVVPTFHGYSPSGSASNAPLIYANFCGFADFDYLRSRNISVQGAVVLCRYKRLFRGIKVQLAQSNGAAAVLIYSDPQQDGAIVGPTYPTGPWRPRTSVERGSVMFLSLYSGDPLTPSGPSLPGTPRIPISESNTPSIPSLPISANDALPLLRALAVSESGSNNNWAPSDWNGGLVDASFPAYAIGPAAARVDFHYEATTTVDTEIWNVIATIQGVEEPDRIVLLGNHRDAWTFGATDPNSGSAPFLEVLRSFGLMKQQGWLPRRTIIGCSWDMEEYGLVGSTEWVEEHAAMLTEKAVAYINVDVGVTGTKFSADASPALAGLIRYAAKHIPAPDDPTRSLYDTWPSEISAALGGKQVGFLGSGSDFTPFLQHLGIASADFGLSGPYGVYHSVLDEFNWMQSFGDPHFTNGRAVAQLWGFIVLTLADSIILPFDHRETAYQLGLHLDAVQQLALQEDLVLDFQPLQLSINNFAAAAMALHTQIANAVEFTPAEIDHINDRLFRTERHFLSAAGLPGRPFYRHQVYAPGLFTGYSAAPFPAIDDAIRTHDVSSAYLAIRTLADLIENAALFLSS